MAAIVRWQPPGMTEPEAGYGKLMVDIWVRLLRFVLVLTETMITPLNVRQTDGRCRG